MDNLTQKEKTLLEDQKKHEQLCIQKYSKYSQDASAQQLKSLFQTLGQHEQQHLDTINQILSGTVPSVSSGSQSGQQQSSSQQSSMQQNTSNQQSSSSGSNNQNDSYMCTDALSTEKHVSSNYNTAIFEFRDKNIRQVLNHIQKEEQEHGEQIYNYMSQNGMYN